MISIYSVQLSKFREPPLTARHCSNSHLCKLLLPTPSQLLPKPLQTSSRSRYSPNFSLRSGSWSWSLQPRFQETLLSSTIRKRDDRLPLYYLRQSPRSLADLPGIQERGLEELQVCFKGGTGRPMYLHELGCRYSRFPCVKTSVELFMHTRPLEGRFAGRIATYFDKRCPLHKTLKLLAFKNRNLCPADASQNDHHQM